MRIHIAINGACGRMGQRLVALAKDDPQLRLVAAVAGATNPHQGKDAGEVAGCGHLGVPIRHDLPVGLRIDALVDCSAPAGTMAVLPVCVDRRVPIVIATTGHSDGQKADIGAAAHHTAVLVAPNMSPVVNLLSKLVRLAAEALNRKGFDAEIVERHHRFKKDAPSGTAVRFAEIIREVQGGHSVHGREGLVGERKPDKIGIHAVRGGDNVGEHTIIFTTIGETLELVHKGHNRDSYARGALLAAKFLANRPAGRYTMNDVLGL
jgi:4-hydroxy-tetrahydrodipicolinate reductase